MQRPAKGGSAAGRGDNIESDGKERDKARVTRMVRRMEWAVNKGHGPRNRRKTESEIRGRGVDRMLGEAR